MSCPRKSLYKELPESQKKTTKVGSLLTENTTTGLEQA